MTPVETPERCDAIVYRRDTYRYTGRTKSRFEMHYTKCRCKRPAKVDGLCGQHAGLVAKWGEGFVSRWRRP